MGGTYRSARLPVRGPPTTGWFRQKSAVAVDFGRQRSISAKIDSGHRLASSEEGSGVDV
ncbi:hypothetical protein BHE74_00035676, partial [Ensete ventricosum]